MPWPSYCSICDQSIFDAEHIAIDDNGEPVVMCEDCYQKARPFFEEVKRNGKFDS